MTQEAKLQEFFRVPRVILAPMAGITDPVFRQLCVRFGAEATFSEMVSAKGLSYENARTEDMLTLGAEETSISVQLFGHEPEVLAAQAARVEELLGERLFTLNINMGCPARKIVTKGDGSALMKNPVLAADIVRACKATVKTPVTVKFRRGWSEGKETCVEFAKAMEDAGADVITVHGRFAEQMYRGESDRGAIARVKQAVSIPVVGNGDIRSGADALRMLQETGCDSIMVARAAEGNPWVFADIRASLSTLRGEQLPSEYVPPTILERMAIATEHAEAACRLLGGAARMRRQAMGYVTGLPGASQARFELCSCNCFEDFRRVFEKVSTYAS